MRTKILFSILFLIYIFHYQNSFARKDRHKIDSLDALLKITGSDTIKVSIYNDLFNLYEFEDTGKAHKYIQKAIDLSEEVNFKKGLGVSYTNLGFFYEDIGSYALAITCYKKSLQIFKELGNKKKMSSCYTNIGNVYYFLTDYLKAIEFYQQSLKITEELGDKKGMAKNYCNIGLVHSYQRDFAKAIENNLKGTNLLKELLKNTTKESEIEDLKGALGNSVNNIGIAYESQKNYKEATKYYKEALTIYKEIGDRKGIASVSMNIGSSLGELGNYKLANEYFLESLKIDIEVGNKSGEALALSNIAGVYNELGQYNKAIEFADKSLKMSEEINSLDRIKAAYLALFFAYKGLKQFEKSLDYHELYTQMNDSIFNTEKFNQISKMEAIYNNDKQHKEIELLNKDHELQQTELRNQRLQKFAFIGGFLVMISLSFVIYRSYRNKRDANILLQTQKQEIAEKNEELFQQNEEISAQRDEIENQKYLIEYKQKETLDSIYYARRIQRALLASEELLGTYLKDYFIYFKPKDIVSGDFYWATEIHGVDGPGRNNFMLCTADSTGHGVPGAIMSMLNISCLNEAVNAQKLVEPSEILNYTRTKIIQNLANDGSLEGGQDGMDCSLIKFDFDNNKIVFSAANNPIWIVRKISSEVLKFVSKEEQLNENQTQKLANSKTHELLEFIPDKMPVGRHAKDNLSFSQQTISIQKGDVVYTFTDGFSDQFGGSKQKKFMLKQLKTLLLSINQLPMPEQKEKLNDVFQNWKGALEQIDDVLLIGVRV